MFRRPGINSWIPCETARKIFEATSGEIAERASGTAKEILERTSGQILEGIHRRIPENPEGSLEEHLEESLKKIDDSWGNSWNFFFVLNLLNTI